MLQVRKNPECHWLRIVPILRVGLCGSWYFKLDFIFVHLSVTTSATTSVTTTTTTAATATTIATSTTTNEV